MESVIDQVGKIREESAEAEILDTLNKIVENRSDQTLHKHFLNLLNNERMDNQVAINLFAAGTFGICLGGKYMQAGNPGDYKIHPFLHKLRKGMLACPGLRSTLKANSRKYNFYPEFVESIWTLRKRIAAIAKAHAGADYGNDVLTVLYSLAGFFSKSESETGLRDAKAAGGTTCVMTARGIYHAAGANMIGDRDPSVGTPNGPQVDLGVPNHRTLSNGGRRPQATLMRDDQYRYGAKGFNDDDADERNRPLLEAGDIYYVDGDGDFKFLLRTGGAVAAHVGIVVDAVGTAVHTVDGGSGTGAKIDLNSNRHVKFAKDLGWTLDRPGKSYSTANINEVEAYMARFRSSEAVIAWLKQNLRVGRPLLDELDRVQKDKDRVGANAKLLEQLEDRKNKTIDRARRLIKEVKKTSSAAALGQDRVLKGWWKPIHYPELNYVGRDTLKAWLVA